MFSLAETALNKEDREEFGIASRDAYYGIPRNMMVDQAKELSGLDRAAVIDIQAYIRNPESIRGALLNAAKGGR